MGSIVLYNEVLKVSWKESVSFNIASHWGWVKNILIEYHMNDILVDQHRLILCRAT